MLYLEMDRSQSSRLCNIPVRLDRALDTPLFKALQVLLSILMLPDRAYRIWVYLQKMGLWMT